MAKDLKHRIPAYRNTKRRSGVFRRISILGLLCALLGVALTYALRSEKQDGGPVLAKEKRTEKPLPLFSYFRILEDREATVPENQVSEDQRNLRLGKSTQKGSFCLLIGTYKSRNEAEAMKAQLASFDALKPRMEEVTLEFASWFRLKLGPYGTLNDANMVRLFLRDQRIDSILEAESAD